MGVLNLVQKLPTKQVFVAIVTASPNMADREKADTYIEVLDYYEKPITMESCARIKEYAAALCLTE